MPCWQWPLVILQDFLYKWILYPSNLASLSLVFAVNIGWNLPPYLPRVQTCLDPAPSSSHTHFDFLTKTNYSASISSTFVASATATALGHTTTSNDLDRGEGGGRCNNGKDNRRASADCLAAARRGGQAMLPYHASLRYHWTTLLTLRQMVMVSSGQWWQQQLLLHGGTQLQQWDDDLQSDRRPTSPL